MSRFAAAGPHASRRRRAARQRDGAGASDPLALPAHHFVQLWLLLVAFIALALAVLHDRGLLSLLFTLDRSQVTGVIVALVLFGSGHALWHLLIGSGRIEYASRGLTGQPADGAHDGFVETFIEVGGASDTAAEDLLEHYAERLRAPAELGWFLVDSAVRLGLLGTIIGFILIFTSLSSISMDGAEGLSELLVAMSGGMGTALLTTLAGLVGASLLAVQYLVLGRQAEHLLGVLARRRLQAGHDRTG